MLSHKDFYKYFEDEKVGIYPVTSKIEDGFLGLTASTIAWVIKDRSFEGADLPALNAVEGDIIKIPAKRTVIILSNESVYLDKGFSGIVLSKVSTRTHGIVFSASPIKPGCSGPLRLSFHNVTGEDYNDLKVGDECAVVMIDVCKNVIENNLERITREERRIESEKCADSLKDLAPEELHERIINKFKEINMYYEDDLFEAMKRDQGYDSFCEPYKSKMSKRKQKIKKSIDFFVHKLLVPIITAAVGGLIGAIIVYVALRQ